MLPVTPSLRRSARRRRLPHWVIQTAQVWLGVWPGAVPGGPGRLHWQVRHPPGRPVYSLVDLRARARPLFLLKKCDNDRRPSTGSRLFYISSSQWTIISVLAPVHGPPQESMMSGVCTKSSKSAKSPSGALDAHFVMSSCILCADLK
jgi:hypothetical protein